MLGGSAGNDFLFGGLGNDWHFAYAGDDLLADGSGDDYFSGNVGNDDLNAVDSSPSPVNADYVSGYAGFDHCAVDAYDTSYGTVTGCDF